MIDGQSFEAGLEWLVGGEPGDVRALLMRAATGFEYDNYRFSAKERPVRSGLSVIEIRADATGAGVGGGAIGMINVDGLPGHRTRMSVSPRPPGTEANWRPDQGGVLFSAYLTQAISELRRLGFLTSSSRFHSYAVLETARRELHAAEDSTSFANIGNSCRAALVALGNELYEPHMLPEGHTEPKGDDAEAKLRYVARHYLAGRSDRYRGGLVKAIDGVIEGVWDMASPLVHRHETATREEAEATLALVAALFEAFSFVIPS
jgi:hypothetical protein